MRNLELLINNMKAIKDILEKGKVIELRPAVNIEHKRRERAATKQRRDPLHQPAKKPQHIETSEAAHLTGGKKGWMARDTGVSEAGINVRDFGHEKTRSTLELDHAKEEHRKVLEGLKAQPKPKLTKTERCTIAKNGQWDIVED